MTYAQEKSGQKLHLVFEYNGKVSQPVCGKKVEGYRMTINVPLANECKNCRKVLQTTANKKEKEFLLSCMGV